MDQVRAKAVLLRDLEELRSKRIALENPPVPPVEPVRAASVEVGSPSQNGKEESTHSTPQPIVKEEKPHISEAAPVSGELAKEDLAEIPEQTNDVQGPSPPNSDNLNIKPEPNDRRTDSSIVPPNASPPPATDENHDSLIDTLFNSLDSGTDTATSDINFDDISFLNNSATQGNSHNDDNEFDLSTFGNNLQDLHMTDIQGANESRNNNNATDNSQDALFGAANTTGGDDMMDLDGHNLPAEENSFDDLYYIGDIGGVGEGPEMEHGEFDDAFFGIK